MTKKDSTQGGVFQLLPLHHDHLQTMPLYTVYHSISISAEQRHALADAITKLHCSAFTTPSFFVHVHFIAEDANDGNYFTGGKPRLTSSNRIVGNVRTSPSRTKEDFDNLATDIEKAWYRIVDGSIDDDPKRLRLVAFTQLVAIREGGFNAPVAGKEKEWANEMMPYFKEMSGKGLDDFTDMIKELHQRDDLKKMMAS